MTELQFTALTVALIIGPVLLIAVCALTAGKAQPPKAHPSTPGWVPLNLDDAFFDRLEADMRENP